MSGTLCQEVHDITLDGDLVEPPPVARERTPDDVLADPRGPGYLKERSASVGRPDEVVPFRIRRADSHWIHVGIVGSDRRFDVSNFVRLGPFCPAPAGVRS